MSGGLLCAGEVQGSACEVQGSAKCTVNGVVWLVGWLMLLQ